MFECFRCTCRGLDVLAGGCAQSSPPVTSPQSPPLPKSPAAAPRVKSPDTKGRKSVTSLCSNGSNGVANASQVRSPSPKSSAQALPEIQITRTESNRSTANEKWVKPKELDEDKGNKRINRHFIRFGI